MQDTNIDEITEEFEKNHALTIQLLQFINSGYFNFSKRISSIHHVLTLIGRVYLSQWLMLMVYSKSVSKSGGVSPLILMAKSRTELMEGFLKAINPNVKSDILGEAYFKVDPIVIKTLILKSIESVNSFERSLKPE